MPRYVIGEDGQEYVVGDDDVEGDVLGAAPPRQIIRRPVRMNLPPRPGWRRDPIAPGVPPMGYGKEILATVIDNGGVFNATNNSLFLRGLPQKAFQPLRMVVTVAKSMGVASILIATSFLVGASNVLVGISGFSIEPYTNQGLDLGFKLPPCAQGQIIQMQIVANPPLTMMDTIALDVQFLGHTVHS